MHEIIKHHVKLDMDMIGTSRHDYSDLEYTKMLYSMSLKLLEELKQ